MAALISSNNKVWGEFYMHPLKTNMRLALAGNVVFSDDAGGEEENMEAFSLEVACELIGTTEQTRGVRVVNK